MKKIPSITDTGLAERITSGQVGVLPCDTIYGLVASAVNREATARLYKTKSREKKPGTIIAADIDQLVKLGIPRRYLKAVEQYWPGAVSVIVPAEADLSYLHLGKFSLACRIPANEQLCQLLRQTGPLITTSANHPDQPPADTVAQAEAYFNDKVDFYVDGGDLSGHPPSTIIRIVDDAVEVIRQGAVTIDEASGSIVS